MINWCRAKWAALSRLPSDNFKSTEDTQFLPFSDKAKTFIQDATELEKQSQEYKMIKGNLDKTGSDTNRFG